MSTHWRARHHAHRRLYTNRPLEVNSRKVPIWQQLAALVIFTVTSVLIVVLAQASWLVWIILAVWGLGLELIVRQSRRG